MNRNLPITAPHCIDDEDDKHRTPEQQRALHALHSDGGFSSWERVLASASPENRADILRNALIELYGLAAEASVNYTEIFDWGVALGELHNIGGDADGLQAIIAEAIGITDLSPAQSANVSAELKTEEVAVGTVRAEARRVLRNLPHNSNRNAYS